jgi:hypothetical protein
VRCSEGTPFVEPSVSEASRPWGQTSFGVTLGLPEQASQVLEKTCCAASYDPWVQSVQPMFLPGPVGLTAGKLVP